MSTVQPVLGAVSAVIHSATGRTIAEVREEAQEHHARHSMHTTATSWTPGTHGSRDIASTSVGLQPSNGSPLVSSAARESPRRYGVHPDIASRDTKQRAAAHASPVRTSQDEIPTLQEIAKPKELRGEDGTMV